MVATTHCGVHSRVVRVRKSTGRGMQEGLLYVEAYLPLDTQAFAEFSHLVAKVGAEQAAADNPELAKKALTPIDSHGEAMLQEDLIQLAHAFLVESRKMDVQHDEDARDALDIVQSFVNTEEIASPHYWPGAWVVVVRVKKGTPEWDAVESGELDAVSFAARVHKIAVTAAPTGA